MRYQPIRGPHALVKNSYVSPNWTSEEIEMVQKARRVMGTNGAFPPRPALVRKFNSASCFKEAFELYPLERRPKRWKT